MRVAELIERLKELPQDSFVYLDDKAMATCLGLAHIESFYNNGFDVETKEALTIGTVVLSTYNWHETDEKNKGTENG